MTGYLLPARGKNSGFQFGSIPQKLVAIRRIQTKHKVEGGNLKGGRVGGRYMLWRRGARESLNFVEEV